MDTRIGHAWPTIPAAEVDPIRIRGIQVKDLGVRTDSNNLALVDREGCMLR